MTACLAIALLCLTRLLYSVEVLDPAQNQEAVSEQEAYLSWSQEQAIALGRRMRVDGRVGGFFDTRILSTDRSYNYKLRATWLTPETIRATARAEQIRSYLTDDETRQLVREAEEAGDTIVLVEIDPREGSGVIPRDWLALLRPIGHPEGERGVVRGVSVNKLRRVKALAGVVPRNYDYDVFWIVFPLVDEKGEPVVREVVSQVELVVRIYNKEGRVHWPVPPSIRERTRRLASLWEKTGQFWRESYE